MKLFCLGVCMRKNDIGFCHEFHEFHEVFQNFKPRISPISQNVAKVYTTNCTEFCISLRHELHEFHEMFEKLIQIDNEISWLCLFAEK